MKELINKNIYKSWIYILPLVILALGSYLHYMRGSYSFSLSSGMRTWGADDAFITFRYGWNLAQFNTLSWNESGYRLTEGFTNPLWVLVSAVWSLTGIKDLVYPLSVVTSVIISSIFLLILIQSVYRKNDESLASILGLVMVVAVPAIWLHMTSGLESGVFGAGLATLAYLVIFYDTRQPKSYLIFFLAVFLGLLRSDGFIYLIMILLAGLIAGSQTWKSLLFGIVFSFLILFIWRFLSFGTFLPNTAIAKINFGLQERIPIAILFLKATLINSGLVIFLLFGVAGLWLETRKAGLAGLFIILGWLSYYIYIGGDGYFERHLIGLYFLLAAYSAPLWKVAKSFTRIIFIVVILLAGFVSINSYANRFSYLASKPNDPWIMLGKALESDRDHFGVLITFAAGKIPFYAGGDNIDLLGLNDAYLATLKQDQFSPGHSSGNIHAAIELANSHPSGISSTFSYLDPQFINSPDDISLWVNNNPPQDTVQTNVTKDQWNAAKASGNELIWSIISNPILSEVSNQQ